MTKLPFVFETLNFAKFESPILHAQFVAKYVVFERPSLIESAYYIFFKIL